MLEDKHVVLQGGSGNQLGCCMNCAVLSIDSALAICIIIIIGCPEWQHFVCEEFEELCVESE